MKKLSIIINLTLSIMLSIGTMPVVASNYPSSLDDNDSLYTAVNNIETNLDGAIGTGDTTITVDSTTGFPSSGHIQIDSEIISYTSKTGTQFQSATRGADSTTPASHLDNADVKFSIIAVHHNALKDAIVATQTELGTDPAGAFTDVDARLDDIETDIATNVTDIDTLEAVDTESELEGYLTDVTNLIVSTEIDTESELETILTDVSNMIISTEIDTEAEVEALLSDVTDLFTNNDGALDDDDLTDNDLDSLQNVAALTEANGDILYYNSSAWQRLAKGSDTEVLTLASGLPSWAAPATATITIEEADGTPTGSFDTVQFDQADGFTVTDEGSNQAQIDLANVPTSVMAFDPIEETELDTESELETQITDMANIIQATEIDTESELETIVTDMSNILQETEVDTESELEAIVTDMANIIQATEIDTFSEVDTLVADKALVNKADGAVWSGVHDYGGATSLETPNTTVASLPAAGTVGRIAIVTDGNSATDCTTGGGSTQNACMDNGTSWEVIGDGTSAGAGITTVQEADSTVDGAANTLDFGSGFDVTSSPAGEANVVMDLSENVTGDVSFTGNAATVTDIQGVDVLSGTPTDGHVLTYDSGDSRWEAQAPAGGSLVGCRVYDASSQTISSGSNTAINFDSERWDDDSMHDNSTNNTRITIPTGEGGRYIIGANIRMDADTTPYNSEVYEIRIRLNGSTYIADVTRTPQNTAANHTNINTVYELSAADYVELVIFQNTGGNIDTDVQANYSPEFWVQKVSD